MYQTVPIPLTDLLLDMSNARLGEEQSSQQQVYLTLGKQQGKRLISLAEDIVTNGTDPTNLPAVVATDDRRRRYKVIEGNRRVLALKALDNPAIVSGALGASDHRRLVELSVQYAENAVDELTCVLFDNEADAYHWVTLRHTGANDGAGLVEWDANEQDRFRSRHGQGRQRKPAGQLLDYLDGIDGPSDSKARVVTTLQRIINTKSVRDALGIQVTDGQVLSRYPASELQKGLRKIIEDLRGGAIKVKDVYEAKDRERYIGSFSSNDLPNPATQLKDPVALTDLDESNVPAAATAKPKQPRKPRVKAARTAVAPSDCRINPGPPRLNRIFNELASLDADTYPNAGAVLLRVFLELSVDNEIEKHSLMTEPERFKAPLSKRLKLVADTMHNDGRISDQLRRAVQKVADSQHTLAASTVTFNQFVHNKYVHPKPSEVRTAWDELQPFLEQVWQ